MKFEIKLTETQKYILKTTTGYSGLPLVLSESDVKTNRDEHISLPEIEIPSWKIDILKKIKEREQLQEQNLRELRRFYDERKFLYESCSVGRNRGEAALAFRNVLSLNDREELERLSAEHRRISKKHEKIINKEGATYSRQYSKLIGIVGLALHIDNDPWDALDYYIHLIPRENLFAVRAAAASGTFSKDVAKEDLEILRYIHEETQCPKAIQKKRKNPTFSVMSIASGLSRTDITVIEKSMYQLTGLLCHLYLPKHPAFFSSSETTSSYIDEWFIPKRRMPLVREMCRL